MSTPIGWPEAQRICDIPEVREALDKFAADAHDENMLAMVSAIMGHASAQGRAAGLEEVPLGRRVSVDAGALKMVLNTLRRDAEEGRTARGEMADALWESCIREDATPSPTPSDAGKDDARDAALEEAIRDAIAENMTGLYYCCRTWSAWHVGTMSQNDFWPAGDDDEIIQNITDGVMAALSSLEVIGKGEKG